MRHHNNYFTVRYVICIAIVFCYNIHISDGFVTFVATVVATSGSIVNKQTNFITPATFIIAHPISDVGTVSRRTIQRMEMSASMKTMSNVLPLIHASDIWGNWSILCGIAAISQIIGQRTMIGKLLGPPVTAMALSFVAATVGVLSPGGTVAAKTLQLLSLQYATPLILLGADFRRNTLQRCGPLIVSFAAASVSTVMACCIGWSVAGSSLTQSLGMRDGIAIAAALLSKNVGGGINYIAVCRTLQVSPNAIAAGLCVDNLFALLYFPITSILSRGRLDIVSTYHTENNERSDIAIEADKDITKEVSQSDSNESVRRISMVLFLSTVLLWIGEKLGRDNGSLPACTVLTVLFVSCVPPTWITPSVQKTAHELGLVALYLFFATAGAPGIAVAQSVRTSLIPLTVYLSCLYTFHGSILYLMHKLVGPHRFGGAFVPQCLLVSSSAAIGGPATAVALATEAKWKSLMVPSLIVGNIGYAIATFCGLLFHTIFKTT